MIKKIIKKIIVAVSVVFLFLNFVNPSLAEYDFKKDSGIAKIATPAGYEGTSSPEFYIGKILFLAFSFIGVIFMGLILYSGILWMTAQGNPSQVSKAKDTIIKSIVGLVIIISAYVITFFVINYLQNTPQVTQADQNIINAWL